MADLHWVDAPERASARRAIRHALRETDPGLEVLAEGFLAAETEIDLLAVGSEGEIVSIRFARSGEEAEMLTRSLGDLTWLRPRVADFRKLAPGMGLEPSAAPRAILLGVEFGPDTQGAIEILPKGSISLVRYRCFRQEGQLCAVLEPVLTGSIGSRREAESTRPRASASTGARGLPPSPALDFTLRTGFRTRLSDADLQVATDEKTPA